MNQDAALKQAVAEADSARFIWLFTKLNKASIAPLARTLEEFRRFIDGAIDADEWATLNSKLRDSIKTAEAPRQG